MSHEAPRATHRWSQRATADSRPTWATRPAPDLRHWTGPACPLGDAQPPSLVSLAPRSALATRSRAARHRCARSTGPKTMNLNSEWRTVLTTTGVRGQEGPASARTCEARAENSKAVAKSRPRGRSLDAHPRPVLGLRPAGGLPSQIVALRAPQGGRASMSWCAQLASAVRWVTRLDAIATSNATHPALCSPRTRN